MKCQVCNKQIRLLKGQDTRTLCAVCQALSELKPQEIKVTQQKRTDKKPDAKKFLCHDCGKPTAGYYRCEACKAKWHKKNADCFT